MATPDLTIIIPTYNEEKRFPPTLGRMLAYLNEHMPGRYEIVVTDDGSRDRTVELVEEYIKKYPQVRIKPFGHNRGRGAVVRDGILAAQSKYILETDADGSVADEAIIRFVQYLDGHPDIDMLIGSRTVPGARIVTKQPLLRVFLGYCFMALASVLFRWKFIDRVNGFKMFRCLAAHDIYRHQFSDHYIAEAEVVYVAERRGWRIEELPVLWTDFRDSRIKPIRDSFRSLRGMLEILSNDAKGFYSVGLPAVERETNSTGRGL